MIAIGSKVITTTTATLYSGAGLGYSIVGSVLAGVTGTTVGYDQSWRDGAFWRVDFGAVTGWAQEAKLQEEVVVVPPPIDPPPLPQTGLIPAFGSSMISDHYNTGPADWIDLATLPAPVPFTGWHDPVNKIIAPSQNGVRPAKLRRIPLYGNATGLYSCVPMIQNGKHRQWNPEVYSGRDFASITPRCTKDPAPMGVRGQCIVDPYGVPRPHPQPTHNFNPRAPLYVTLEPSGRLVFELPEKLVSAGIIPGLKDPHDFAFDETNLDHFFVANTGMGTVVEVDRRPAIAARPPGGVEDASLYVVTTIATGFQKVTSVEVLQDGTLWACDETAGAVYGIASGVKVPVVSGLVRPFCIRRTSQSNLLIATSHLSVREYDTAAMQLGPEKMPAQYLRTVPATQKEWTWIGVDEAGTLGPKDEFYVCDSSSTNNVAVWQFRNDGSVLFNAQIMGQQSTTTVGDNAHGVEWSHYFWTVVPHTSQALLRSTGFANCFPTYLRAPIPSDAPEEPHDHALYRRGEEVIKYGTARSMPADVRPSLTALMTPTGASLLGITPDYMVQEAKRQGWAWLESFIQNGMGGTTKRPELVGRDLYGLFYLIVKSSSQYLSEGGQLWGWARNYILGKYPSASTNDGGFAARKMDGSETFLRASMMGQGFVTVKGEDKWGNPKMIGSGVLVDVIVNEGRPGEQQYTALSMPWKLAITFSPGPHAITCRTTTANHFSYGVTV
jgi:hypothetical protein